MTVVNKPDASRAGGIISKILSVPEKALKKVAKLATSSSEIVSDPKITLETAKQFIRFIEPFGLAERLGKAAVESIKNRDSGPIVKELEQLGSGFLKFTNNPLNLLEPVIGRRSPEKNSAVKKFGKASTGATIGPIPGFIQGLESGLDKSD
jgi:hypothetical protein